jgi:dihydrofolate reductase
MRRIISFAHVSLDGFVAGPNGEMDWIKAVGEIFEYVGKRIGEGDTAMYGRVTYQLMESYWPVVGASPTANKQEIEHSKWYSQIHKIILSHTLNEADLPNTTIINSNLAERINQVKQVGDKEILLFGSPSATHALMKEGLIDGYWLFVNPMVLGKGIPLFSDVKEQAKLNLVHTQQFNCGVTELSYIVEGR